MELKDILKYIAALIVFIVVATLSLNSFTIVDAGTTKVGTLFGTVDDTYLTEGIHSVNPMKSFDVFDTRNKKYEINGLNIPTQDRFNSTGNVTVLYKISDAKTPWIKTTYGTSSEFLDITLRQQLRSIIRDEGRKIENSLGLAQSDKVTSLQYSTQTRLVKALEGTGIVVDEVLIQDITFDPRIAKQILATQKRIQNEEAEKSKARMAASTADIAIANALGKSESDKLASDAINYAISEKGKAIAAAIIAKGNAERDADIARAEGNLKLSRTLTVEILRKQELDNQLVLNQSSKGEVPSSVTILNSGDLQTLGFPFATMK